MRTGRALTRSRRQSRWALPLVAIALLLLSAGCYRTSYTNFAPPDVNSTARATSPRSSSWRSFYLYGYLPSELVIDAAAECGGSSRLREIRTRQTFTQGLISMFATSSGVNAYAPWTGEVVCVDDPAD